MPYIGNEPADRFTSIPTVQQFNGDGSTTAFTLSRTVSSDQDILVSVDGVIQDTAAYAVSSGTTLTFSAAPSTGTANIFVNHLGLTIGSVVHPASSALVATTGTFSGAISATTGEFNRTSSDGDIVVFKKDGSAVGSIGTLFGDLYAATGNTGIRFVDANRSVSPYDSNASALVDAAVDLGYASARYKDLYLSGGVFIGGTGAANKLDDYEEGTWTPGLAFGGAVVGMVYSNQVGAYTKVGNMVTASCYCTFSNKGSSTGSALLTGLPFTSSSTAGTFCTASMWVTSVNFADALQTYNVPNSSEMSFAEVTNAGTDTAMDNTNFTNASGVMINVTYRV